MLAGFNTQGDAMRPGQAVLWVMLVCGAITGAVVGGEGLWLHWVCKPLATLMLLWWVRRAACVHDGYRRWVSAGLLLSCLGDVWLMLPADMFVPGLLSFLLAHLCYIRAFVPGLRASALLLASIPLLLFALANVMGLWPWLPDGMHVPVLVYVLVIACMAAVALAQWLGQRPAGLSGRAGLAAVGALLFLLSDALLAWDRFAAAVPWAIIWVLLSYYLAQRCIAGSVLAGGSDAAPDAQAVSEPVQ